ncbi:MAG: ABC transporter ATP-binding protein [Leucothrix sp.]
MNKQSITHNQALISFRNVSKRYAKRQIFSDVNVSCYAAKAYLLTGENGSGKSTLLRVMAGLLTPDSGQVTIVNEKKAVALDWSKQLAKLRASVMYLHQMPYLFDGSVEKNLSYVVNSQSSAEQQILDVLKWSGLEDLAASPAKQLSGGEKQRVALARACLRNAQVLLLDEPTANLDQASRLKTLELLASLKQSGVSLVIACHEYQEFLSISNGILELKNGMLQEI